MLFLRLLRRVLKILQSELTPGQIGAGVALGAFLGLSPLGAHLLLPFSLALLLRLSFSAFLLSGAFFKIFYLPLRPLSYLIGRSLLEWPPLDPLWQTVLQWPIIAPLGFNRYLLLGSYVLALLIALPAFFLTRSLVARYRAGFIALIERSATYQRLKERRWFKLALRLVGGEARFLTPRRRGLFRYVRREMLLGLPLFYLALYLLAGAVVPLLADTIVTKAGSALVGGEVEVERSSFNLFTGRLSIHGLNVQNPQKREENVVEASEVALDLGILSLLSKRVVFNEGSVRELRFNVRREADGSLNLDNFRRDWNWEPYLRWLRANADRIDWVKLFRKFVEHLRERPPRRIPPLRGAKRLRARSPSFALEELNVERLRLTLRDDYKGSEMPRITALDVVLENLSIDSRLGRRPLLLRLSGEVTMPGSEEKAHFALQARLDYRHEPAVREYAIELKGLDLPAFAEFYAASLPVRVLSGKLTLATKLTITGREVHAENNVLLENLQLALQADSIFGLDPATSQKVIEGLNRYGAEFPLVFAFLIDGPTFAPRFHWEKPLLEAAQKGLMLLGQRELRRYIDRLGLKILDLERQGEALPALEEGFAQIHQKVQEMITRELGLPGEVTEEELEAFQELLKRILEGEGAN